MFYVSCPHGVYVTEGPFNTEEVARECALSLSADSADFFDGVCQVMELREGNAEGEVVAKITADAPLDPNDPSLGWDTTDEELKALGSYEV